MTSQTLRKSEQILKSYKGAQHILTLNPKIQFLIIGFMGVVSVALFVLLPFQNLIFIVLGLVVGIFWTRLFVLMLDVAIFRRREEKERKLDQKIYHVLDAELKTLLSPESINELSQTISSAVSKALESGFTEDLKITDALWKKIDELEHDINTERTTRQQSEKRHEENDRIWMRAFQKVYAELDLERIARQKAETELESEKKEQDQLFSEKTQTQNIEHE